jgi:hypothetical protein
MIVRVAYICGMFYHHCLKSLFIASDLMYINKTCTLHFAFVDRLPNNISY